MGAKKIPSNNLKLDEYSKKKIPHVAAEEKAERRLGTKGRKDNLETLEKGQLLPHPNGSLSSETRKTQRGKRQTTKPESYIYCRKSEKEDMPKSKPQDRGDQRKNVSDHN